LACESLWAFVVFDREFNEDRIVSAQDSRGCWAPLVTELEKDVPKLRSVARRYSRKNDGAEVRIVRYAKVEEMEKFTATYDHEFCPKCKKLVGVMPGRENREYIAPHEVNGGLCPGAGKVVL
jgi:hypothetical protein